MLNRVHHAHDLHAGMLAVASGSQSVAIWEVNVEEPGAGRHAGDPGDPGVGRPADWRIETQRSALCGLAFVGPSTLVTLHVTGALAAWKVGADNAPVELVWEEMLGVEPCAFAVHGDYEQPDFEMALGSKAGQVLVVSTDADGVADIGRAQPAHDHDVTALCFSDDGHRLASAGRGRKVYLWDLTAANSGGRLELRDTLDDCEAWPLCLGFSHDSRHLAAGCMDNGVYLWELGADHETTLVGARFDQHGWIVDVAFSPDDSRVAAASWDTTVGMYDVDGLVGQFVCERHRDYVSAVYFVPRTDHLISVGYDRQVGCWDWRAAGLAGFERAHTDWILDVFGLDDTHFVTLSGDHTARIWDSQTMVCVDALGEGLSGGIELGGDGSFARFVGGGLDRREPSQPANLARAVRQLSDTASAGKAPMAMLDEIADAASQDTGLGTGLDAAVADAAQPAARLDEALDGADLGGEDLDGEDLDRTDLGGEDLDGEDLDGDDVEAADPDVEDLDVEDLDVGDLDVEDLDVGDLGVGDLGWEDLDVEDLDGQDLDGEDLDGEDLDGEDLDGEDLDGQDLDGQDLDGQDLDGQDLDGQDLDGQDLDGQDLDGQDSVAAIDVGGVLADGGQSMATNSDALGDFLDGAPDDLGLASVSSTGGAFDTTNDTPADDTPADDGETAFSTRQVTAELDRSEVEAAVAADSSRGPISVEIASEASDLGDPGDDDGAQAAKISEASEASEPVEASTSAEASESKKPSLKSRLRATLTNLNSVKQPSDTSGDAGNTGDQQPVGDDSEPVYVGSIGQTTTTSKIDLGIGKEAFDGLDDSDAPPDEITPASSLGSGQESTSPADYADSAPAGAIDAPESDAPESDAPESDAPESDAPESDAPESDAPESDAPESDAPESDAPESGPAGSGAENVQTDKSMADESVADDVSAPVLAHPDDSQTAVEVGNTTQMGMSANLDAGSTTDGAGPARHSTDDRSGTLTKAKPLSEVIDDRAADEHAADASVVPAETDGVDSEQAPSLNAHDLEADGSNADDLDADDLEADGLEQPTKAEQESAESPATPAGATLSMGAVGPPGDDAENHTRRVDADVLNKIRSGTVNGNSAGRLTPGKPGTSDLQVHEVDADSAEAAQDRSGGQDVVETDFSDLWDRRSSASAPGMGIISRPLAADTPYALVNTIETPHRWIYGVALYPKSKLLATCGGDDTVQIWGFDGHKKHQFEVDTDGLNDVVFAGDGTLVVAGGDDALVHGWVLPQKTLAKADTIRHATLAGHDSWISSLALSDNQKVLLSASFDGTVHGWYLQEGRADAVLEGHGGPVTGVGFGRNGLMSASHDGTLRVWNPSGLQLDQLDGHGKVLGMACSESAYVWSSAAGRVYVCDDKGARQLANHDDEVSAVTLSDDDGVASAGKRGVIHIYQPGSDAPFQSIDLPEAVWALERAGDYLAAGGDDGRVHVYKRR